MATPRRRPQPQRKVPAPPPPDLREIGATGLQQFGGLVYEEFQPNLAGLRARRVFKEMAENDPIVGSILFAVDMLIRQIDWKVTIDPERIDMAQESEKKRKQAGAPSSQPLLPSRSDSTTRGESRAPTPVEAQAEEYAQFINSARNDLEDSWDATISTIMTMLIQGWSWLEVVYKLRGGPDDEDPTTYSKYSDKLFGWRKMPIRAQESLYRWEIADNGDILGMWQQTPPRYERILIPADRSLLFRTTTTKNNPEGRSALRNAYRPWYMKKQIEELEGIGIERDLAGLPVAWVPPSMLSPTATPQEVAVLTEIKRIVRNVKRDEQEGVVFPLAYDDTGHKLFDFTLMTSGGRRHFDLDATITRWDQRIAMTVLADFILLGHAEVGSFALGTSKIDMFTAALESWVKMVTSVFNHTAIPRLMKVNGFAVSLSPILTTSDINAVDLKDLSLYLQALSATGMPLFPDEPLELFLRDQAGFPPPSAELHAAVEQKKRQAELMTQMQVEGLKQKQQQAANGQVDGQVDGQTNGKVDDAANSPNNGKIPAKTGPPSGGRGNSGGGALTSAAAATASTSKGAGSGSKSSGSQPGGKGQPQPPGGPQGPGGPNN